MSSGEMMERGRYLTFTMGEEGFGLEVAHVREIMELTRITEVPGAPVFMRGVINLRGNVVPVIDLGVKLGITGRGRTVDTCIIVVEVPFEGENTVMGAVVDSVQEVVEFGDDEIEATPKIGTGIKKDLIKGIGKRQGGFIMILDARVFSAEELVIVDAGGRAAGEG